MVLYLWDLFRDAAFFKFFSDLADVFADLNSILDATDVAQLENINVIIAKIRYLIFRFI